MAKTKTKSKKKVVAKKKATGRPKSEYPLNDRVSVRLDNDIRQHIADITRKEYRTSFSEMTRVLILRGIKATDPELVSDVP